jgi:hypothetical protein
MCVKFVLFLHLSAPSERECVREREWAIEKETQVIKRCNTSVGRMREKETREKLEGQGEKD